MARLSRLLLAAVLSGASLALPGLTEAAEPGYIVRAGDTLIGIATRLQVPLTDLLRVNQLTVNSLIVPGQQLTVPGAGGGGDGGSSGTTYVVRASDWLGRIAARHGVSLAALLAANNLSVNSVIVPGQRLTIPGVGNTGGGATPSGGSVASSYTVRAGDTLSGIASRHGVTLGALLRANNLTSSSLIMPGRQLRIPGPGTIGGGSSAPSPTAPASERIQRVINYALAQVGKRWVFGARGPNAFDCSGLTLAAYSQVGVSLVHYSAAQARQGAAVNFRQTPIRAGDVVFQDTDGDGVINHVGIALSATRWVQARSSQFNVTVGPLPVTSRIVAVRRFLPTG